MVTGVIGFYLLTIPSPMIVALVHGIWGVTTIMTFWPALMKTLRSLGSKNEQSKVFGFFEGGRGVVNAVYLAAAVGVFGYFTLKGGSILGIKVLIGAYSAIAIVLGLLLTFLLKGMNESQESGNDVKLSDIGKVMKYPAAWLMILIVFCTYFINMSFYYVGPYVTQAFGASAVFAVILSTASQYIRPFTAIGAGILGDRINSSKVIVIAQFLSLASIVLLLLVPGEAKLMPLIILSVVLMYVAMYATQSMHFAIMEETDFPKETVGTVIGMICCIGYLPESICPYLAGRLFDAFPGATGYRYYFLIMGVVTVIGLLVVLYWMSKTTEKRRMLQASKNKIKE